MIIEGFIRPGPDVAYLLLLNPIRNCLNFVDYNFTLEVGVNWDFRIYKILKLNLV